MTQQPTTQFFIRCIPPKSTAQGSAMIMRRRDGSQFVGKAADSKGARAKRDLMTLFSMHRPEKAYSGPVSLDVQWVYPWRKSEPKKNRAGGYRYCDKRPDIDNLCKLLLDVMTTLDYWGDDGQVARLSFEKAWGDDPGIFIRITPIE